jgi:plastocyanin
MKKLQFAVLVFLVLTSASVAVYADGYVITLKDNAFSPQELVLPANEKVKLTVRNESKASAEFESEDLSREKVVAANSEVIINLGPLKPGTYKYVNDFHRETTGVITVK